MTPDTEALRAQFEWSFAETGYDLTRCEICPNEYADGGTNDLWLGYQAGHAAAKAEVAEIGEPVAWMTVNDDGDPAMLFFDYAEAMSYCGDGEVPIELFSADQLAAAVAKERKDWPPGILDRIAAAMKRIDDGDCPRRIPADPTDVDLVLAELRDYITGKKPPFWLDAIRAGAKEPSDA